MRLNVPDDLAPRIDAVVEDMNAHAPPGYATNRAATVALLLRNALDRYEEMVRDPHRFAVSEHGITPPPTPRLKAVPRD